jgi:short-subunit dehydrogenase
MSTENTDKHQQQLLLAAGLASLLSGFLVWQRRRAVRNNTVQSQFGTPPSRALITGASSGIGETFARQLAARGYDLVIVARREALLQDLAADLADRYGVEIHVFQADLANKVDLERLEDFIAQQEPLALLVNNAGFGTHGKFANVPVEPYLDMITVHLEATVRLTRAVLPGMIAVGQGGIINVSSIASFLPVPGSVLYSATKSFLNLFSETLQVELGQQGIFVQSLCPGYTHTGFHSTDTQKNVLRQTFPDFMWSEPGYVVETSLNALGNGQVIVVPGVVNQAIVAFAQNSLTRPIVREVIRWLFLRSKKPSGPLASARSEPTES